MEHLEVRLHGHEGVVVVHSGLRCPLRSTRGRLEHAVVGRAYAGPSASVEWNTQLYLAGRHSAVDIRPNTEVAIVGRSNARRGIGRVVIERRREVRRVLPGP